MTTARDAERRLLQAAMVARLDRVRGDLTDEQFGTLVRRIEATAARFAEIDAGGAPSTRFPATTVERPPHLW